MIGILLLPLVAAVVVFLAGRKDAARDPRMTIFLLALLITYPLGAALAPKLVVLPEGGASGDTIAASVFSVAIAVWAAGCAIFLLRLAIASMLLRRIVARATEVRRIGRVSIRESADVDGPVAAGILRPAVLLPVSWRSWGDAERNVVLSHELAHHRRRDPLLRLIAEIARTIYWFHPPVHWMAARFAAQSEFACDELVVRSGIEPKHYATILCDFAETRLRSRLAFAMADGRPLESRVRRILRPATPSGTASLVLLAVLAGLGAGLFAISGSQREIPVPADEIELRLSADPFPGND
ncbi:MAG: M56 family metallopeptidase [Verrucomicrobiae bacterium]|nr:M56 family metallopeptidase [Verrucomicrobiae bacterium]